MDNKDILKAMAKQMQMLMAQSPKGSRLSMRYLPNQSQQSSPSYPDSAQPGIPGKKITTNDIIDVHDSLEKDISFDKM